MVPPCQTPARITGGVWMGRDIGRGNTWTLSKNGVALTGRTIYSGEAYGRANPFTYALGSGGERRAHRSAKRHARVCSTVLRQRRAH